MTQTSYLCHPHNSSCYSDCQYSRVVSKQAHKGSLTPLASPKQTATDEQAPLPIVLEEKDDKVELRDADHLVDVAPTPVPARAPSPKTRSGAKLVASRCQAHEVVCSRDITGSRTDSTARLFLFARWCYRGLCKQGG